MAFQPLKASEEISEKYMRYLRTIFKIDDPEYQSQFEKLLSDGRQFANGPFLDVTDSFRKGRSPEQLIQEGILPAGFRKLGFPMQRELYLHQEQAVIKSLSGNNMVVSTGTGSGKTESFLIPLLAEIITQHEQRNLRAGIRALIIYPMNALANDQMERLRTVLRDYPEITYGSYTGQTRKTYIEALADYIALNDGASPNKNELISREQMQATPPHIMITNYAMLEYLMVRPDDSVFFDEEFTKNWKYIILDEAHVYSGATGIEVSMLLRRLKATLRKEDIRYILTSATLGDKDSDKEVARFASELCDSPFSEKDVVRATRLDLMRDESVRELPKDFYVKMGNICMRDDIDLQAGDDVLFQFAGVHVANKDLKSALFDVLKGDRTFRRIKEYVSVPRKITQIASAMGWSVEEIEKFVFTASKAEKNNARLFDSRYHMFLRATESVFITLGNNKKLFLDRKEYDEGEVSIPKQKVFEIATCSTCHAIYLVGKIENGKLIQTARSVEDGADLFLLRDSISDTDEDHLIEDDDMNVTEYELCPYCGFIQDKSLVNKKSCEHNRAEYKTVWRVERNGKNLTKCLACEVTRNTGITRMFFTGQEAVTSVIGTALFEALPSYSVSVIEKRAETDGFEDDGFDDGFEDNVRGGETIAVNSAKQFLAFSDSRQAAAFYSTYMDRTYKGILNKRLILEAINKTGGTASFAELVSELEGIIRHYGVCEKGESPRRKAYTALLSELVDNIGSTSLFRTGLLGVDLDISRFRSNKRFNLSAEDVKTICCEFLLTMLSDGAFSTDIEPTAEELEEITFGGFRYSYTESDSDSKKGRKAFKPSREKLNNKRVDYVTRIFNVSLNGEKVERSAVIAFLTGVWSRFMTESSNGLLRKEDAAYRVDTKSLILTNKQRWYICPKCRRITASNVQGVCPSYRCDGCLVPVDIDTMFHDNHYFEIYRNMEIRPLRIKEHTAQLSRETAYEYQKEFINKNIDVLSCSTTFEMGVDVGSLETVFMRNMPPSPSNYAQRAGRAGRSSDSAAFALTFCNKSNHDFTFFRDPSKMINGKIVPPSFEPENEKIAIRHIYASAFAFFWKKNPDSFKKVRDLCGDGENDKGNIERFKEYLRSEPEDLKDFLKRFLPSRLSSRFDVDHYGWIDTLISDDEQNKGVLNLAYSEYLEDVEVLLNERKKLHEAQKGDGYVLQRLRTYREEQTIAFLARKGAFPRYGFPVDTVELGIPVGGKEKPGRVVGLQLSRDLSMAISEYAPGSQIVANGELITSRYIKKAPNMLWKTYDYKRCDNCNSLFLRVHTDEPDEEMFSACPSCGHSLSGLIRSFIIPEFGFEADPKSITKPTLIKPKRVYSNEASYIGKDSSNFVEYMIGRSSISVRHSQKDEMAVINTNGYYVCQQCGYAELDEEGDISRRFRKHKHESPSGYVCRNEQLRRFSLGYRFETNIVQLRFEDGLLPASSSEDWEYAYSVLQGILRGFCTYFSVDERDISGCLQYYRNEQTGKGNYALVLYDNTPGGSGFVKMLDGKLQLENVLKETRLIMKKCICGGEDGDTSCYSCLRNYYNQRYHERIKRRYVISFLNGVLQ